jgi:hypothetical protein
MIEEVKFLEDQQVETLKNQKSRGHYKMFAETGILCDKREFEGEE